LQGIADKTINYIYHKRSVINMKNRRALSMSWEFLGWLLLVFLLAVVFLLAFPSIADGFEKGVEYVKNLV